MKSLHCALGIGLCVLRFKAVASDRCVGQSTWSGYSMPQNSFTTFFPHQRKHNAPNVAFVFRLFHILREVQMHCTTGICFDLPNCVLGLRVSAVSERGSVVPDHCETNPGI